MTRVINTARGSQHLLSVGQLRNTPIGRYTQDQLESAGELVDRELETALRTEDEEGLKRLKVDADELTAELERREVTAA